MTNDINNIPYIGFDLGLEGFIDGWTFLVVKDYNIEI